MAASSGVALAKKFVPLNDAEYEHAKSMYFHRCIGCHGILELYRNEELKTKGTLGLGTKKLTKIISYGTGGGMPNFDDIFSAKEIDLLARYIQMEPPTPLEVIPLI